MKRVAPLLVLSFCVLLLQSCTDSHNDSHNAVQGDLLARLEALESESEIRHKLQTYMAVLDASDWDNFVNYFTYDATLIMTEGNREGRDDIQQRMSAASTRMAAAAQGQPVRKRINLLSNIEIEVNGNTASAQSRFSFISENGEGGYAVYGSGLYIDKWAVEEGEWRISEREVDFDMLPGPAPSASEPTR